MSSNAVDAAGRSNRLVEWTLVTLGYCVAAVGFTWPLLPQLFTHLGALEGPGDPYLELWVLGWNLHALTTAPETLFNLRIFDANIFHPAAGTLAYSDHLLLQSIVLLPVYWATRDPVACYNVLLIGSLAASGVAMYAYAREVSGSRAGAIVAGVAWAFWPYRIARLLHINLQALYFLPLALLFLHRVVTGRRRRDALWLGVFAGLQAISSLNYGVVTAVALAVVAAVLAVGVGRWRSVALARRLVLAALVGVLLLAPFAWPYYQAQLREGFARNLFEASQHAARVSSYLQVPDANILYGRTHVLTARDARGALRPWRREGVERELFPGFVLLALGLVGAWVGRRQGNWPVVAALCVVALAGFVFSLGPDGIRPVYAAAYHYVFGFQAIRAPARFGILVTGALAVLAALAVAHLGGARPRRAWGIVGALVGLMAVEYASVPLPLVPRPPQQTAVGQWLASVPGPGAVLHLPLTLDRRNTPPMVQSLEHWRPVVNGHSGQRPAFFAALVDVVSVFPTSEALWTLKEFNVRFVVAPRPLEVPADGLGFGLEDRSLADTPLVERARLADGVVYELVWTPEIEARMPRPAPPAPPPPGPIPFAVGERAVYDVGWVGGPLGMAAGRATITVEAAESGGFRFVARAETAEWVRQFFEARDEYATTADRELLPLEHRRDQRQGRREVSRTFTFDHAGGVVRISRPGAPESDAVVLSVPPGTRDALTAFFYVRTLGLEPGQAITLPVNDGGRNLVLDLKATAIERIAVLGRQVEALRVEPRIVQRVARRAPVQLTVWLSRDGRSLPLAAEVQAGFGRLRLELTQANAK